jgi:histone H3/H4
MAEMLVVASKVKEAIKAQGCNTGGDVAEALSIEVGAMLNKACERAKANGRKTVTAKDI